MAALGRVTSTARRTTTTCTRREIAWKFPFRTRRSADCGARSPVGDRSTKRPSRTKQRVRRPSVAANRQVKQRKLAQLISSQTASVCRQSLQPGAIGSCRIAVERMRTEDWTVRRERSSSSRCSRNRCACASSRFRCALHGTKQTTTVTNRPKDRRDPVLSHGSVETFRMGGFC